MNKVKYLHYDINVTPNLNIFTFTCEEKIHISVLAETKQITLNAVDVVINECKLYCQETEEIITPKTSLSNNCFYVDTLLCIGYYVLYIKFTGKIQNKTTKKGFK